MKVVLNTLFVGNDRVAIRWHLEGRVKGEVEYRIERSGNAQTGYVTIHQTNATAYVDQVDLGSKFIPLYYRVTASCAGKDLATSDPSGLERLPSPRAHALQRRERYQLAKSDGVPAMLFSRRRGGAPCPRCVARTAQGSFSSECTTCYGTGVKFGYYPPMPFYVAQQTLDQAGLSLEDTGANETRYVGLWTSNWSIVEDEDIIYEMVPPNRVWRVTAVQRSSLQRATLRQILSVNEVDKGAAVYLLPVPHFAFPAREDVYLFDHDGIPPIDFETVFAGLLSTYVPPKPGESDPTLPPRGGSMEPQIGRNPVDKLNR
jgi:hypothetical protein